MLAASGLGALCAGRFAFTDRHVAGTDRHVAGADRRSIVWRVLLMMSLIVLHLGLTRGSDFLLSAPPSIAALIFLALLALPSFFMGFPFPLAMERLPRQEEIPWALALNGFGSLIGGLTAPLLAVHLGFDGLLMTAAAVYIAALLLFPNVRSTCG